MTARSSSTIMLYNDRKYTTIPTIKSGDNMIRIIQIPDDDDDDDDDQHHRCDDRLFLFLFLFLLLVFDNEDVTVRCS